MTGSVVSWYSGGVTSTIATLRAIERWGDVRIVFFETGSHHPDNERFFADCERLFERSIESIQHRGFNDVFDLFVKEKFINSPYGARCTLLMKKRMRQDWEKENGFTHQVFGFESDLREISRAQRFLRDYPYTNAVFPLIEEGTTKEDCISELESYGIELPAMYRLGYSNNNCVGCVKGGMGYWNKIRIDFPEVFDRMAQVERIVGASAINGVYLDELDPTRGRMSKPLVQSCGIFCE